MAALFWIVIALAGSYWFYTDYKASGSLTGKDYYEACWELKSKMKGFTEPPPSTPYQAGQWKQCEPVAQRAIYDNGLIFAGIEAGEDAQKLRRSCPDKWSEVPVAGVFYLYVKDTEAEGGVQGLFRILPANWAIGAWARTRWPHCSEVRESLGFPKVVQKDDGTFGWEKPCPKCK
jgi:hypothetical protein